MVNQNRMNHHDHKQFIWDEMFDPPIDSSRESFPQRDRSLITEVALQYKNLTGDSIIGILLEFPNLTALDLSNNRIETIPRALPSNIIGLNLSNNELARLEGISNCSHIIELKLCSNGIDR